MLDYVNYYSRDYILSYDRRNRTAHWVFEHITRESVARNEEVDRNKASFAEDQSIHPYFRSKNSDYKVNQKSSCKSYIRKDVIFIKLK